MHRRLLVLGRPAGQDVVWLSRSGVVLRTTAQVAALQQVFELWWQDGDPCEV